MKYEIDFTPLKAILDHLNNDIKELYVTPQEVMLLQNLPNSRYSVSTIKEQQDVKSSSSDFIFVGHLTHNNKTVKVFTNKLKGM